MARQAAELPSSSGVDAPGRGAGALEPSGPRGPAASHRAPEQHGRQQRGDPEPVRDIEGARAEGEVQSGRKGRPGVHRPGVGRRAAGRPQHESTRDRQRIHDHEVLEHPGVEEQQHQVGCPAQGRMEDGSFGPGPAAGFQPPLQQVDRLEDRDFSEISVEFGDGKYTGTASWWGEEVDVDKAMSGAMRGLADGLDPDSAFLRPELVKAMASTAAAPDATRVSAHASIAWPVTNSSTPATSARRCCCSATTTRSTRSARSRDCPSVSTARARTAPASST